MRHAHPAPPERPIVPLKNAIRVLNGFGKSLEVILPKLRDGYIVPDPSFARELALENPDAFFLSQSGECFHNVTVTGGKQRAEGPLSMKRELRDVLRQLEELEQALRDEEMRVLTLGREIKELTSLLDRLEGEKREAEKQAMTSGHMLQQLDAEMARVERAPADVRQPNCSGWQRSARSRKHLLRPAADARLPRRAKARRARASDRPPARSSCPALRERRDQAAQNDFAACWPGWPRSKSAIASRSGSAGAHRVAGRRNARARVRAALADRMPPPPRKLQRETENQQLAGQLVDLEAETQRRRGPRRPAAVRVRTGPRPAGGNRRSYCSRPASCSTRRATAAANCRRPRPSCSPTRSTWRRPA